ncbi:Altered inheritance of mitochondria protein 6 [Fusarium falciforme]|uniref:Altered inheritance of mitochondria protein 6 n=1 Tax=Fusarium falciforme TaxID=195108 RepID=A0A9W8R565_9HYPO|nr:Altered inheritance of mitochondria protein 6 [Fusarium falciforme]
MYIQPLVELLQTKNSVNDPNIPFRGVYDHDPSQTLVLLVDLKADPNSSWPLLLERLEPLRQRGWLSHVNNGAFISRPITVVGTGDTEVRLVNEETPFRDVFFDAPLNELEEGEFSSLNSYYTSVSFEKTIGKIGRGGLQPEQLAKLRNQISLAHSRGLKARYWGMPYWPIHVRDQLRELLIDEGVDVLNADDLVEARDIFARRGRLVE